MPLRFRLSETQLQWVRETNPSPQQVAEKLGCCVDTAIRVLVRQGVYSEDCYGSKYVARRAEPTWSRPCMKCGSTDTRPKWQYVCDECKEKAECGSDDEVYLLHA